MKEITGIERRHNIARRSNIVGWVHFTCNEAEDIENCWIKTYAIRLTDGELCHNYTAPQRSATVNTTLHRQLRCLIGKRCGLEKAVDIIVNTYLDNEFEQQGRVSADAVGTEWDISE